MKKFLIDNCIRSSVLAMHGYVHGRQCSETQYIRLNANENPFPIPLCIQEVVAKIGECDLRLYPDEQSAGVCNAIATAYSVSSDQIILDNGSSALLSVIFRATLDPLDVVVSVSPTFALYETLAHIQAAVYKEVSVMSDESLPVDAILALNPRVIIIPNPNAPMGYAVSMVEIEHLIDNCSGVVIIDEAYADFAQENALYLIQKYSNVIITRTFSKAYSLAGLRFGFGFSSCAIIENLNKVRSTYTLNSITQKIAQAVFENLEEFKPSIKEIQRLKNNLTIELRKRDFIVMPSETNFLFVLVPDNTGLAFEWEVQLKDKGILVRCYPRSKNLQKNLRISVGSQQDIKNLLCAIDEILMT